MEPQIQELQPWNRDHIVHAIHTFFLGVYLLKRINVPENHATRYNPALMWKLIGPTHDLGYPIEIAGNIRKGFIGIMNGILSEINPDALQLKQKACPANLEVLCDGRSANDLIQNRLDEWKLGIDVTDYYEWLQERNRVDHGVIGALAQLKVMDALCQEKDAMRIEGNLRTQVACGLMRRFVNWTWCQPLPPCLSTTSIPLSSFYQQDTFPCSADRIFAFYL